MILGSLLIILVHVLLALPMLTWWPIAVVAMLILGVGFSLVPSAMWPSVPKLIPERQLGTAYALIFWLQNLIALTLVPFGIGKVLDGFCITGRTTVPQTIDGVLRDVEIVQYDYTLPMAIFVGVGLLAVVFALLLKREDRRQGYGLEQPSKVVGA